MKVHLAWIRRTAAAALVVGFGVHPAVAQYAPFRPMPQQPAAPKQAPVAAAPTTPYVAYRTQPAYQPVPPAYQPAPVYQPVPPAYQPAPVYQQAPPTARYQAPVTPVPPAAPAVAYRQPVAVYPQTAMTQYPAAYGTQPYYVANQQPTEAIPAPAQPATSAPVTESMSAQGMSAEGMAPMAQGAAGPVGSGYAAAGCNCGAAGGYSAGQYYGAGGCGCQGAYPECGCCNDCGPENIWFGGVYLLYMDRVDCSPVRLSVDVPNGSTYPYYPTQSTTVVNTAQVATDYQPGVEFRFGSTFTCGEACNQCGCGSGYGYGNGGCGCNSCAPTRMYAWEVAAWGLDEDDNQYTFVDTIGGSMHGMKNFAGLQFDRDGAGAYVARPVNDYYGYAMPVPAGPYDPIILAQQVRSTFQAENLELNVMRFPICDTCGTGGGGCGCDGDACGCGNSGCGGCDCDCGCDSGCTSYGSCGVRYFRTDEDFFYNSEFNEGADGHTAYDGWGFDNSNEICYDLQLENNLTGPQVGWTANYCYCCRWNFFWNSTFGIFDNHITHRQRLWNGADGFATFQNTGQSFNISNSKDSVSFLGELRVGGSYDITCHCRLVAAYRALGLTGVATPQGQFQNDMSSYESVAYINSCQSVVIHGLQTGVECRY